MLLFNIYYLVLVSLFKMLSYFNYFNFLIKNFLYHVKQTYY